MKCFTILLLILVLFQAFHCKRLTKFKRYRAKSVSTPNVEFFASTMHVADNSYSPKKLPNANFELIEEISQEDFDAHAIVALSKIENIVYVGFRGTDISSWKNIKTDLNAFQVKYFLKGCSECYAHEGFWKHYSSLVQKVD